MALSVLRFVENRMRLFRRDIAVSAALRSFRGKLRKLRRVNPRLVKSVCPRCRSFLAASARPDLLEFVEQLHHCGQLN